MVEKIMDDPSLGQRFAENPCQVFLQGVKTTGKMAGPLSGWHEDGRKQCLA